MCVCACVVRAKPNRITLGPSPNYASACTVWPDFLLLKVFICMDPLGDWIRR